MIRVRLAAPTPAGSATVRVGAALLMAAPAVTIRLTGGHPRPVPAVLIFGAGLLAAVALLFWAAEAARVDVSGSLALSLLALVTVLPEYAIDLYFGYAAGGDPAYAPYATANMTGANRLLIGVAWPLLVFFAIWAVRHRDRRARAAAANGAPPPAGGGTPPPSAGNSAPSAGNSAPAGEATPAMTADRNQVRLRPHRRVEIGFLALATCYAWVIPLTGRLAWYDTVVLGGLFLAYLWRIRHVRQAEEELVGVAARVATQRAGWRRTLVVALFVAAGVIILAVAEPFGDALIEAGSVLGVDEFLLVQWLAPLASEAPEILVAITFALRGRADDGLGALLAAKLNQWTLLIACLPVAYLLGGGGIAGLPLDARQVEELVLTAGQTLLGVAILADLRLTRSEAVLLLALFAVQLALPSPGARYAIAGVYLALAVVLLIRRRREIPPLLTAVVRAG